MSGKHIANIDISLPTADLAKTVYRALRPETGFKAKIVVKGNIISLKLEADTTATLRALTNSYLRWIITVISCLNC